MANNQVSKEEARVYDFDLTEAQVIPPPVPEDSIASAILEERIEAAIATLGTNYRVNPNFKENSNTQEEASQYQEGGTGEILLKVVREGGKFSDSKLVPIEGHQADLVDVRKKNPINERGRRRVRTDNSSCVNQLLGGVKDPSLNIVFSFCVDPATAPIASLPTQPSIYLNLTISILKQALPSAPLCLSNAFETLSYRTAQDLSLPIDSADPNHPLSPPFEPAVISPPCMQLPPSYSSFKPAISLWPSVSYNLRSQDKGLSRILSTQFLSLPSLRLHYRGMMLMPEAKILGTIELRLPFTVSHRMEEVKESGLPQKGPKGPFCLCLNLWVGFARVRLGEAKDEGNFFMKIRESRQTNMENKNCDICGATGYSECLVACFQCKQACEHVYCMREYLRYGPYIWYCEACRPQKKSNSKTRSDAVKISSPLQRTSAPVPRNSYLKGVETGRVKYIPAEEVIMLTSGTKRKVAVDSSSQFGPSDAMSSISKRTSSVSTSLPKCYVRKQNATPKKRAVQTQPLCGDRITKHKLSLGEKLELSKVKGREESAEVHERPSYAFSPPIESLSTRNTGGASDFDQQSQVTLHKPVHLVGGASLIDSQYQKSIQEKDLAVFSSRFAEVHENLPALAFTWKGSFEIVDMSSCSHFYDGFRAHPPGKISRKAYEFSKKMPGVLQFKLQNHSDVWAEVFDSYSPAGSDIALYFFPGDFERSIQMYHGLYTHLEMHDFAMRTYLEGVELLIFTSKQLPLDSRINMKFYLWGVFHRIGSRSRFRNIRLQLFPLGVKKEEAAQEPETDELGIRLGWFGSRKSIKNEPNEPASSNSMAMEGACSEQSLSRPQYMKDRDRWNRAISRGRL
ncbi:hypothetical protein NE237_007490 [Protea cynaroides]|uniref:AIPP2-like SPOC-like domain-containing protein n=1 Tax=Protea cynaroides TaxID=273540 RepID=A0A9Q0KQC5_9MAGN|nr:hypothetical protein NE237_007490 [Protea cynaroides]